MTLRAVDCQGFAGGFTLGMVQAGFELIGKREMKGGFGVPNCEANRHLLGYDWRSEAVDPRHWTVRDADVVFGNPPCSGFSVMSAKSFRGANSKINHCMWAFVEYAGRVRPQVAVFESVQVARTSVDGHALMVALRDKLDELTDDRWTLYHVRHNALQVGGASERRRYFWVAARVPFGVEHEAPSRFPTLNDVIGDLDGLELRWESQPYDQDPTWWSAQRRSYRGVVDGHVGLDNPLTRRLRDLMEGVEWPAGMAVGEVCRLHWERHGKLPDSWRATEEKIVKNDFFMGFTTPVRWHGDRPGRVITGGGLHNVVHPTLPRTITHRETARILGFPDDWLIDPLRGVTGLNMTWGKGITVDCGRWIGRWIRSSLEGSPGSITGTQIGEREFDIDLTHGVRTTTHRSPGIVTQATRSHQRRPTMTDEQGTAGTATRGRPRPQSTIERDENALKIITAAGPDGITRAELATQLGAEGGHAYLSIYRLSRGAEPKIVKRGNRWVDPNAAAPAEAPAENAESTDGPPMPEFTG